MEDEDYKLGIMKYCKSVQTRLVHFKKKTDRFKPGQYVLPKDSYDMLINELDDFVKAIDDCVGKIVYLVLNERKYSMRNNRTGGWLQEHLIGHEAHPDWSFGKAT